MFIKLLVVYYFGVCLASDRWPNHDISTLKLLQIVHRHGDRSPTHFPPNDPFKDLNKYWVEGLGELTTKGKYRMYKLGEFIRQEYNQYLGDKYSPREVYARSSLADRCIESLSNLLSGAYPPKQKEWQWGNDSDAALGKVWQPFPIQTFMPKNDDLVLNHEKKCNRVDKALEERYNKSDVKMFLKANEELYRNVSAYVGETVDTIGFAGGLEGVLDIEMFYNHFWTNVWTKEEEIEIAAQLHKSHLASYRYEWDTPIIQRLRAGGLVKELNANFDKVLKNKNDKKLYVYSTHDTHIAAFMHAMNIYNDLLLPFGTTFFIELHQNKNKEYFVRYFYHNETVVNTQSPYSIPLNNCQKLIDCPINQYMDSTKHLLYDDFDKECNS